MAVPVVAVLELRAERRSFAREIYILKPTTTAGIALVAVLTPQPVSLQYQTAIVLGLLCSLAGDVFLMLPRNRFLAGLACFFVAHICYLAAFAGPYGLPNSPLVLLCFAAYGICLLRRLWPRLGRYRMPVAVYTCVLLLMAVAAHQQLMRASSLRAWLAFTGALLFVLSDSVLALDRFEVGAKRRQLLVLSTYFLAQWLIAASVEQPAG